MVCISGFQLLGNLGPQKTQQMSGSPSVFWKEAACTPPISQVPNPLAAAHFHSWLYRLTVPPTPHPATDSPSKNWALPHSHSQHLGSLPWAVAWGTRERWERVAGLGMFQSSCCARSCLIKGLLWAH